MSYPTKKQMQDLLAKDFSDVEIVCERPCFYGAMSLSSFGLVGHLVIYADETGKKFAVQVPFGVREMAEKRAAA